MNNRNFSLTVLEAGQSKINTLADLVSASWFIDSHLFAITSLTWQKRPGSSLGASLYRH